jgi:hypothetical protein
MPSSYFYILTGTPLISLASGTVRSYLWSVGEEIGKIIFKRHFQTSPREVAKQLDFLVNESYKEAVQHAEDALEAEKLAFKKLEQNKEKRFRLDDKDVDRKNHYDKKIEILADEYKGRTVVTEIAKNLVVKAGETREVVHRLIIRLLNLFNEKGKVKENDINALKTTAEKPKVFNTELAQILSSLDKVSAIKDNLNAARDRLIEKTDEFNNLIKLNKNVDKILLEKNEAEKNVRDLEEEVKKSDENLQKSIDDLRDKINISLQLDGLFERSDSETAETLTVGDIEEGVTEILPVSKIDNIYEYYVSKNYFYKDWLPLVKHYAGRCNSVLELNINDMGVLWASLLGLAENIDAKTPTYKGIFPLLPADKISDAKELAVQNGIAFDIITNDPKIESKIDLSTLDKTYDMLFINTWHTYRHYKFVLDKFSPLVTSYIILGGTNRYNNQDNRDYEHFAAGDYSEYPDKYDKTKRGQNVAIAEFLQEHPEWVVHNVHEDFWGLTVLKKNA